MNLMGWEAQDSKLLFGFGRDGLGWFGGWGRERRRPYGERMKARAHKSDSDKTGPPRKLIRFAFCPMREIIGTLENNADTWGSSR